MRIGASAAALTALALAGTLAATQEVAAKAERTAPAVPASAGAGASPAAAPARPAPRRPRCAAANIRWAGTSNTLYLSGRVACTLTELDRLAPKAPLHRPVAGTWQLGANLRLTNGARLDLHGPSAGGDVRKLRLRSDRETAVYVRVQWGTLSLRGTAVTSWDSAKAGPDTNLADKRAFIHARSYLDADGKTPRQSRVDIANSDVGFLGYAAAESYGLTWKVSGKPSPGLFAKVNVLGNVTGSRLHHNYFGAYTYGAYGMRWERNEIDHNIVYGLDPHDDSDALVIRDNHIHHNGGHGIICSQRCDRVLIERNRALSNKGNGIMLHRGVTASRVFNNQASGNADSGIALFESHNNVIEGNRIVGNLRGVRFSVGSARNIVRNNTISNNRGPGLYFFKGSDAPRSGDGRPRRNTIVRNTVKGNEVAVRLGDADDNVFRANDFSGNAGGLLLRGGRGNRIEQVTNGALVETRGGGSTPAETTLSGVRTVRVRQGDGARTLITDARGQVFATEERLATVVGRGGSRLALESAAILGRSTVTARPLWVVPSAGTVKVTPRGWSTAGRLRLEWVASASAAGQRRTWTVGGLPAGRSVTLLRDGKPVATSAPAARGTVRLTEAPGDTAQHTYRVVAAR